MKNLKIYTVIVVCAIAVGMSIPGCNNDIFDIENDNVNVIRNKGNTSLEIADFKNWLKSQEITNKYIGKQAPNWDNAELKIMRDGNSPQVSIEMYRGKNSLGNDSIIELQVAYVNNNFIGSVQVFSFYNREHAHSKYYSLSGQILNEGIYYAPKQLYISLKRYATTTGLIRLKSNSELGNTQGPDTIPNSATPSYNANGDANPDAYNCHSYVWGPPNENDDCYMFSWPQWNECPDIAGSGYSQVTGMPQVGDRWVSWGNLSGYGYAPIHSAFVTEVTNGIVTRVEAKCGDGPIVSYNPNIHYPEYIIGGNGNYYDVKYYRK